MRPSVLVLVCAAVLLCAVDAGRRGGGGSRGGFFSRSKPKTPAPAPRTPAPPRRTDYSKPNSNDQFLNNERGASTGGTTHNRGNTFTPSAPQPHPQQPQPGNTGQIGFEKFGQNSQHGGVSHTPSAPPQPNVPPANGPPPAYSPYPSNTHNTGSYSGAADHPPAYPGRPVNAPPSYSSNNPHNPPPPGFNTQQNSYQGQSHPQQSYPGQGQYHPPGQSYPQNNFPNQNYGNNFGSYPHQTPNQFGNSYHPPGGVSYAPAPGNVGSYSGHGGTPFGGSYPQNTYQSNSFGGSPFGNGGNYNGNPYYNTNNFGYSNNPGYFGGGYQGGGYPGQYEQKKSRFGGLPIPIPIPIPIPLGGFGGFGGFGGGSSSDSSYHHRLLNTFIKKKDNPSGDNSTSVFILNNSTVTPCTTDHFVYDHVKVSVMSCTAEHCTAIKLFTTTNISDVVSVHSAVLTLCLEKEPTFSHSSDDKIDLAVSGLKNETITVCRNVSSVKNETSNSPEVTTVNSTDVTTTEAATTPESTTVTDATTPASTTVDTDVTQVCETVECYSVEMCFPSVEIVDKCTTADCPFRRTGYKPCVNVKMCRSPSTPVSTFASINTTISKIDEFNKFQSTFDFANLTLISYHRPVINFNCTGNSTSVGCPSGSTSPPTSTGSPDSAPASLTLLPNCTSDNSTVPDAGSGNSTNVQATCMPSPANSTSPPTTS